MLTEDELDELIKHLTEHWSEYSFEDIPESERLHPDATICGLMKLYSLMTESNKRIGPVQGADHDIIYLCDIEEMQITRDDVIYLFRCGINYAVHYDGFYCYV